MLLSAETTRIVLLRDCLLSFGRLRSIYFCGVLAGYLHVRTVVAKGTPLTFVKTLDTGNLSVRTCSGISTAHDMLSVSMLLEVLLEPFGVCQGLFGGRSAWHSLYYVLSNVQANERAGVSGKRV